MAKSKEVVKAYNNSKFLNSSEGRTIRILSEFYEPRARFEKQRVKNTVVFFGSARIKSNQQAAKDLAAIRAEEDQSNPQFKRRLQMAENALKMSRYYEDAVELSKRLTEWSMSLSKDEEQFIVCSGGGPGIMEAANKGAKLAGGRSVGLNISIPYEQFVNQYVSQELAFEFHYFFMRKFWFVYLAKALVTFPGGFGTLDELMEVVTLLQTGKIKKEMKVFVYDENYWSKVLNYDFLLAEGTIDKSDLKILHFCNSIDEAFNAITGHLEEYYFKHKKKIG